MTEHKSEKLLALARECGWEANIDVDTSECEISGNASDILWILYAKRKEETIKLPWRGNRMEQGLYVYGHYRKKLWWKSEVVKILRGTPDPRKFHERTRDGDTKPKPEFAPWSEDEPAFNIMTSVVNRKVTWIRKIDGEVCEARVDVNLKDPASAKGFKVYVAKSGRRVLEWVDGLGFHSVALEQIIDVS